MTASHRIAAATSVNITDPTPSALKRSLESSLTSALALGQDIRNMRKSRGMTLSELALKISRSVGFISQLERGISSPSIDDLRAIAHALEVPVSWFFAHENINESERGVIVRSNARRALGTRESGIVEELLSPDLGGSFEIFRSVFESGASIDTDILRETEEAGVLISGELHMWIGGVLYHLMAGDSFRFEHKPYRWQNRGDAPAIVIWVVSPPTY